MAKIINISAYQFVAIEEALLPELKASLLEVARANDLKGTVLLSQEGINLFVDRGIACGWYHIEFLSLPCLIHHNQPH